MGVLPFIQVLLVGYLQIPAPASAFLVSGIPLFQLYPSRQSIAVLSAGGNTAPVTSPFQPHLQSFSSSERPSLLRIERQHPLSPAGLGYSFAQPPYLRKTQMQTKSRGWTRLSAAGSATWHSSSATSNEKATWEKFDYRSHWYPVSWARDLPLHKPTKVTVFDEDYVITRVPSPGPFSANANFTEDEKYEIRAMADRCPHKSAALSEGRVTNKGDFQCAYHGWLFDGKDGRCIQIPQAVSPSALERVVQTEDEGVPASHSSSPLSVSLSTLQANSAKAHSREQSTKKKRQDGIAVPAQISQGMVWLFPYGGLEKALSAPPPPRVPEIDTPGFRVSTVVRDFPIDWPILIENILDPDHGLFAHQNVAFDLYGASMGRKQEVEEEEVVRSGGDTGWTAVARVDAVEKLRAFDKKRRAMTQKGRPGGAKTNTQSKNEGGECKSDEPALQILRATSTYTAPSLIQLCRRNPAKNNTAAFVTAFWVCPVGTGRSRFMSAAVGRTPFSIPRWLVHINLNNFLDQDTYLLVNQQKHVLAEEVRDLDHTDSAARKRAYVYRSPTEKLQVRLGAFLDTTLSRVPNRRTTLRALGTPDEILHTPNPPRHVMLDRYEQHTSVCGDSADVVANCERVRSAMLLFGLIVCLVKALGLSLFQTGTRLKGATVGAGLNGMPVATGLKVGSLGMGFGKGLEVLSGSLSIALKGADALLTGKAVTVCLGVAAVLFLLAGKIRKEFFFKYTKAFRDRDMDKIPMVWMD